MKRNIQPFIRGLLFALYFASAFPFLYISASDFFSEWGLALQGESSDAPQHAGMAAMVFMFIPFILSCLLGATALSIYAWWRGLMNLRVRILSWYCILCFVVILQIFGPHAAQFSTRFYFTLYQTLSILPLVVLPVFWLFQELKDKKEFHGQV